TPAGTVQPFTWITARLSPATARRTVLRAQRYLTRRAAVRVEPRDGLRDAQPVPASKSGDRVRGDLGVGRASADLVERRGVRLGDWPGAVAELHAPALPQQHLGLVQRGQVVDGVVRDVRPAAQHRYIQVWSDHVARWV